MSAKFCVREEEVLELVVIGQWPRQASSELLGHVAGCAACADALVVSLAVANANEEALPAVPEAAAVWQRSQLRARHDAARLASRPVVAAQSVAALGTVGVIGAGAAWLAGEAPSLSVMGAALSEGASTALSRVTELAVPALTIGGQTPGLAWLLSGLVIGVIAIVGLALLLSTLADELPDRTLR
jgi:hypothetical protein